MNLITLHVHLTLFALGRRCNAITRNTRGLTRSVIALIVPPLPAPSRALENDADLEPLPLDPFLQLDQLAV